MKRKVLFSFIILVEMFAITGCGGTNPSGKYEYGKEGDKIYGYYDCGSNNQCDWYMYIEIAGETNATYKYTMEKNDDGKYTLQMENIDSNSKHKLTYDKKNKTLYDAELKITYRKK